MNKEVIRVGDNDRLLGELIQSIKDARCDIKDLKSDIKSKADQKDMADLKKSVDSLHNSRAIFPAWLEKTLMAVGAVVGGYLGGKVGGQ